MTGINYNKLAEIAKAKGNLKKAADYYVQAGKLGRAYDSYEKVLSKEDDRIIIEDIRERLKKLSHSHPEFERLFPLVNKAKKRSLESFVGVKIVLAIASIITLLGALSFVSFNLTGYAIGGMTYDNLSFIGTILFILGLAFAFVFFRSKGQKK